MKKLTQRIGLLALSIGIIGLASCSDDDSNSSSSTPAGATNAAADFNGVYTGNFTYIESDKFTNEIDTSVGTGIKINITGTKPNYSLNIDGTSDVLNFASSNNAFTAVGTMGDFAGDTWAGTLNGNTLTLNWAGGDDSSTWIGNFAGNRPASTGGGGGGGGGCNNMSVSGSTVGAFQSSACMVDFEVAFASSQTDYIWHLTVSFDEDCDYGVNNGQYVLLDENNPSYGSGNADIELELEHTGSNPDQIALASTPQSGSITVNNNAGVLQIVASNISLADAAGGARTVSFCVEK